MPELCRFYGVRIKMYAITVRRISTRSMEGMRS